MKIGKMKHEFHLFNNTTAPTIIKTNAPSTSLNTPIISPITSAIKNIAALLPPPDEPLPEYPRLLFAAYQLHLGLFQLCQCFPS